jgi:hypothetical protein
MRNRCPLTFFSTEKSPRTGWRLFDCRDRRIAQNKFFQFIGHTSVRLQKSFRGVHGLIQGNALSERDKVRDTFVAKVWQ